MNTASPILTYTDDLNENCAFLAAARGITGAQILDDMGLEWGLSPDCPQVFLERAPWLVEQMRMARDFADRSNGYAPEQILLLDADQFWHCTIIHGKFYYVVAGSRGSFELFKGRIDRCVQMADQALKEREINRPMMQKALETINRTKGVLGSAVVGTDGILIAAEMSDPGRADLVSALAASLADTGNRVSEACGSGAVEQILLEGESGKVLVLQVNLGWLVVLTSSNVNVGLVRVEMRQAAKAIG